MTAQLRPAGEVMNGLEIRELDEKEIPIDAIVVMKILDADGEQRWAWRTTAGLNTMEIIGALIGTADLERQQLCASFGPEEG